MISVCIATYNGEKYLIDQLDSIRKQLDSNDEIIISDNGSIDRTLDIIMSLNDRRIKLLKLPRRSLGPSDKTVLIRENFMNAIQQARGDYIFMADQDDVWCNNKITVMLTYLKKYSVVVHNAEVVDPNLKLLNRTTYEYLSRGTTVINVLIRSAFMGCCMGFSRKLLPHILNYPSFSAMEYDTWIGLCGMVYGKVKFIDDKLLLYRRHTSNASSCCTRNKLSFHLKRKFCRRVTILRAYWQLRRNKLWGTR